MNKINIDIPYSFVFFLTPKFLQACQTVEEKEENGERSGEEEEEEAPRPTSAEQTVSQTHRARKPRRRVRGPLPT